MSANETSFHLSPNVFKVRSSTRSRGTKQQESLFHGYVKQLYMVHKIIEKRSKRYKRDIQGVPVFLEGHNLRFCVI